jgi:hypothetical protein
MSLASKLTLVGSVTFAVGIISYVHAKQKIDREVQITSPNTSSGSAKMHGGMPGMKQLFGYGCC